MMLFIQEGVGHIFPQVAQRRRLNLSTQVLNSNADAAAREISVLFQPQTDAHVHGTMDG